jgi:protein-disulfide isomerase
MKKVFSLIALVVLLTGFNVFGQKKKPAAKSSKPAAASSAEREKIEKIVRDYILKNPSIIRDATLALAAQEEKEKSARAAESLKTYNKEIFFDASTPTAGNAQGDVKVAVFFDYNCGYCRKSMPGLAEVLKKDSSVQIVYKEFPILGPQSIVAAKAALAAALQGKYLEFHNALLASDETGDENIKSIAEKLGLNYAKLRLDMESKSVVAAIEKNYRLAAALDVNGTPAYIIGERLFPGAVDAEGLKKIIADERAAMRSKKTGGITGETKD